MTVDVAAHGSHVGFTPFKTASASRGNSVASFWAYFRPVWAVQRPSDEGGIPLQADQLATEVLFPCEPPDTQFSREIVSGIGMRGSLEWVFPRKLNSTLSISSRNVTAPVKERQQYHAGLFGCPG